MGMYVTGWAAEMKADEAKYTFAVGAMMTAQDLAEILKIKDLMTIKSVFDINGEYGRINARVFKKIQLSEKALKECVSVTANEVTANIMDIKWKSFSIESGISSDAEASDRVLVTVKGVTSKTTIEDMHHLLRFCEQGKSCETKWVDLQGDINEDMSGEELIHVLRTGKKPVNEQEPDATVKSFHMEGNKS